MTERDSLRRELAAVLAVETRIAALERERDGYETVGKPDRAKAVDAQLQQLRTEGQRSSGEIRRRLRELDDEHADIAITAGYANALRREREDCLRRGLAETRVAAIDAELERIGHALPAPSGRAKARS